MNEISDLVEAEALLRIALPHIFSSHGSSSVFASVLREHAHVAPSHALANEALSLHQQPLSTELDLSDLEEAHYCRELGLTLRVRHSVDGSNQQSLVESVKQLKAPRALSTAMGVFDHVCYAGAMVALANI